MDEGLPIAYAVLEEGVLVYAFHGIVMRTGAGPRFIAADQIASLHERGVDLRIPASEVATLPAPHGAAPAWRDVEPGVKPRRWQKFVDMMTGAPPTKRNWKQED